MDKTWEAFIKGQMEQPYMKKLIAHIKKERETKTIYPPSHLVLNAFRLCPHDSIKVVILGSEAYNDGTDMGLAFSSSGTKASPQLLAMQKEIKADLYSIFKPEMEFKAFKTVNLSQWADQGVLLLNSVLTTEKGVKGAHKGLGWETFVKETLLFLSKHHNDLVFMFWGKMEEYKRFVTEGRHLILCAPKLEGSKHFSQANKFMQERYKLQRGWINWILDDKYETSEQQFEYYKTNIKPLINRKHE